MISFKTGFATSSLKVVKKKKLHGDENVNQTFSTFIPAVFSLLPWRLQSHMLVSVTCRAARIFTFQTV